MSQAAPLPASEVAVTVISCGQRILAVYNPLWGSFTLPMTKRRRWQDPEVAGGQRQEQWSEAAARAAAEWLGRTLTERLELAVDIAEYRQSDRDGVWKRYHFQVFRLSLDNDAPLRPGAVVEWLTAEQFLEEARRPISPTARFLITRLQAEAAGRGEQFP